MSIQINGMKYPIVTDEKPEYVRELAGEMDKTVRQLLDSHRSISINEALVLMALGYLDQSKKAEENADHLRGQLSKYVEDASQARMELAEAKRELSRLERKGGKG